MSNKIYIIFKWLFLTVVVSFILVPVYITVNGAFKSIPEFYQNTFHLVKEPQLENFIKAWVVADMGIYFKNTLIIVAVTTFFVIIFSSMATYAITRSETFKKFDKFIYLFFVFGITIPPQTAIIPLYLLLNRINLTDSIWGLIIVYIAYFIPVGVFLLYWPFSKVPSEILEAAKIDGCSDFMIYLRMVIPLCRSSIITVIIISIVWAWNILLFPLVFISTASNRNLVVGLLAFKGEFNVAYTLMFAGVILVSLPLIIAYLILQKQFMMGLTVINHLPPISPQTPDKIRLLPVQHI